MDKLEEVKLECDPHTQSSSSKPCPWVLKRGKHTGKKCFDVFGFKAYGGKPYCSNHMKGLSEEELKLPEDPKLPEEPEEVPPPEDPLPVQVLSKDPIALQLSIAGRRVSIVIE